MLLHKGKWNGYYQYANKEHQQSVGFEKTYFEIEIVNTEGDRFVGTVQDDRATGGTEGVGEIVGTVSGNRVQFVKKMPIMTLRNLKKGERSTYSKKHRNIYYSGTISDDGKTIRGEWKFKPGIRWINLLLMLLKPTKGTWSMTFQEYAFS